MSIATETVVPDITTFIWKVRRKSGKIDTGISTHSSREGLVRKLLAEPDTQSVLRVDPNKSGTTGFAKTSKKRAVVAASRQLELCLSVGIEDLDAINLIRDSGGIEDAVLTKGLADVSRDMSQGIKMSEAMGKHPYVFPELMTSTIQAGEKGGFVAKAVEQVADDLEAEDEQHAKIKKASTYPIVILVASSAIFIFLMGFIVPQFADLYADMSNGKVQLPFITQVVIGISDQMVWAAPTFIIGALIALIWYKRNAQEDKVREIVDPLKVKLPVFGVMYQKVALTRFCRVFASLLDNGVHPVEALTITASSVGNISMQKAILAARDGLNRGESMVTPLANEPLFPKFLITFIQIGERTGEQSKSLRAVGRLYNRDVDGIINNMAALIEPIFTVVLGVMVGAVAIAIYLPYFSLGDLMGPESMAG